MAALKKTDLKAFRQRLEAERVSLLAASDSTSEDRRPVELDQQSVGRLSRMGAMQVQAMAQALEARRQGRLQRIEAAIKRIDSDDYGYCTSCEEDIPLKRLEIDPAMERCVDCAV